MTDKLAIVQRAPQNIGTRTTITQNDLDTIDRTRPFRRISSTITLGMIFSEWPRGIVPSTRSNSSTSPPSQELRRTPIAPTAIWQKGQPAPPWAYEYQYPVDCLRACFITPQTATGYASGIPITTAVTGGALSFWQDRRLSIRLPIDKFYPVTSAVVASGGQGHLAGI